MTPRWEDDPVWRHNRRRWRGCQGSRGQPLPIKTYDGGKGGGAGQE